MSKRRRLADTPESNAPDAALLSEATRKELDRRIAVYRRDPSAGSPWPEVRRCIRGR